MEELKDMTGACIYCGQTKIVKAYTQEEADREVSLECSCSGGELARRKSSSMSDSTS